MKAIVWFRNDLRLHDQAALSQALSNAAEVLPIYCFDPRQFQELPIGFPKTGPFRAQFLLEAVADLRKGLQHIGGNLLVAQGKPEEVIPHYAKMIGAKKVYASQETTDEELAVDQALERALFSSGIVLERIWQHTLYHPSDLDFPIAKLPDVFTHFRKEVERRSPIRHALPPPTAMRTPEGIENWGDMPSLHNLGLKPFTPDVRRAISFIGGETAGMARIQAYFWDSDALRAYKETRNGLIGADYSSKLSPWLALGCLSPRFVYEEVKRYEQARIANDSTYWLVFELLWRDYFRFVAKKYGNALFKKGGIMGASLPSKGDFRKFRQWVNGQTGRPFVDANMEELRHTGFMSNRGRQNVASYLVKDLHVHWWLGAYYFESMLIDYDPCSNWGNWNYVAGVGNDPRENRYFNIKTQAQRYDPQAQFIKLWLPALANMPAKDLLEQ